MGSRALKQALHARGVDLRLQARDAIAGLAVKELQAQSIWTVEHLAGQADAHQLDGLLRDLFAGVKDCMPTSRKLRYRLVACVLRQQTARHPGQALLFVRDRVVERVGHEDAATASQLQCVMQSLTQACIEAYCRGHFSALGVASKEELPRDWLCSMLISPLLVAVSRGPAKTKLGNACLLADGVLAALKKWSKSAAALHAAVECLKELLKLSGAVALTAREAFLPIQSCVALLGQRLRGAAVQAILHMAVAGMAREEWHVRKAAAETLTQLVLALKQKQHTGGGAAVQEGVPAADSGQSALVQAQLPLLAAVEQHIKYDRIPQVRQAAAALTRELQQLAAPPPPGGDEGVSDGDQGQGQSDAAQRHGKQAAQVGPLPRWASPGQQRSRPRFARPRVSQQQQSSLDFGVQMFGPPAAAAGDPGNARPPPEVQGPQQVQEQQAALVPLPSTSSSLLKALPPPYLQPPVAGLSSGATSAQGAVHHVLHPLFSLRLQGDPPTVALVRTRLSGDSPPTLAAVEVRLEGSCLKVEVGLQPRPSGPITTYHYTLLDGQLQQRNHPAEDDRLLQQPMETQPPALGVHYIPDWPPGSAAAPSADGWRSSSSRLGQLPLGEQATAGRGSVEMDCQGMSSPTKQWVESLRPLDVSAPLLQQPGKGSLASPGSRQLRHSPRRARSPGRDWNGSLLQAPLPSSSPTSPSSPGAEMGWHTNSRPQSLQHVAAAPTCTEAASASSSGVLACTLLRCPPQAQQTPCGAAQSPFSQALSSLGQPLCCESPPMQQQCSPGKDSRQKGPLTAIVTKALSRLQQLQELQQWEEAVSQQLTAGQAGGSPASDTSSVQQADSAAAKTEAQQQQGLPGAPAQGDALYARRSLQPTLSAIAEATTEGCCSSRGSGCSVPEEVESQDELGRLLQFQGRLDAKMREVQACIAVPSAGPVVREEGMERIPAVWPEAPVAAGWRESSASSLNGELEQGVQYSGVLEQPAARWQDNPAFNSSRPGTAMSIQQPQDATAGLAVVPDLAADPQRQRSLHSPPSLSGWSGLGATHSLGSELGLGAGPTEEEEVHAFLRGSIPHPATQQYLAKRPSWDAAKGSREGNSTVGAAASVGGVGARPPRPPAPHAAGERAGQHSSIVDQGPQVVRKERQRWSHLTVSAGNPQTSLQQPAGRGSPVGQQGASSPACTATVRQSLAQLRGSLDLDAIFDSRESSPQASSTGSDHGRPCEQEGAHDFGFERQPSSNLERLHISSRPASPTAPDSIEEAVRGSIYQVLHTTFPGDALERLDRLRAALSPSSRKRLPPASIPTSWRHQQQSTALPAGQSPRQLGAPPTLPAGAGAAYQPQAGCAAAGRRRTADREADSARHGGGADADVGAAYAGGDAGVLPRQGGEAAAAPQAAVQREPLAHDACAPGRE